MRYGITLIILSLLAVPSLFLAKKPNAAELLKKIAPWQGWIGLILCLLGLWDLISAFLNMGFLTSSPIWWITWVVASSLQTVLGFMLGQQAISSLMSKNAEAQKKSEALMTKLAPMKGKLGMAGIGVGIWVIVASILF